MADVAINTFRYDKGNYEEWELPFDYHCLYILENGKEAYIGETKAIIRRSEEHRKFTDICSQYNFRRIHVVTGQTFDETPAKHYETLLIRLMEADGKFRVLNRRKEWVHYGRKNEFELCFDRLWLELEKKGLVRHREFQNVLNLNEYKFSPHIPLTKLQCETLTSIIHTLDSGETAPHTDGFLTRPVLISGDAGSGKTVAATSLFYYLRTHEPYRSMKIGLVYPVSATRDEVGNAFKANPELRKKDVIAPIAVAREHYDIVICDEAQRLRRTENAGQFYRQKMRNMNRQLGLDRENGDELDWILQNSDRQIFFYDEKQSVCSSDIPHESFMARLCARKRGIRPVALNEQMRILAGDAYVPYIYDILYEREPRPRTFDGYELKLFRSFDDMFRMMQEKEQQYGFARQCSGYAWEWVAKNAPERPDIQLDGRTVWWNGALKGWLHDLSAKEEMGSIYTLPGVDLNYAFVVVSPELYYDQAEGCIKARREQLFDKKVTDNVPDEKMKEYLLNTYAVFLTRGIRGTFLYVCDGALREYIHRFIPYV